SRRFSTLLWDAYNGTHIPLTGLPRRGPRRRLSGGRSRGKSKVWLWAEHPGESCPHGDPQPAATHCRRTRYLVAPGAARVRQRRCSTATRLEPLVTVNRTTD